MLRQRVITALILAGALIATLLFAPFPVQAMLFALVAAAGGWEWAALVGAQTALSRALYAAVIPLLCGALCLLCYACCAVYLAEQCRSRWVDLVADVRAVLWQCSWDRKVPRGGNFSL